LRKTPIFLPKIGKIAENCDHNIDPRKSPPPIEACRTKQEFPIKNAFTTKRSDAEQRISRPGWPDWANFRPLSNYLCTLGSCLKISEIAYAYFWATSFHSWGYALTLTKNGLGHVLGDSSGHTAQDWLLFGEDGNNKSDAARPGGVVLWHRLRLAANGAVGSNLARVYVEWWVLECGDPLAAVVNSSDSRAEDLGSYPATYGGRFLRHWCFVKMTLVICMLCNPLCLRHRPSFIFSLPLYLIS
jgi:hypothetical protein